MQEKLKIGEILVRTGLIAESQLRAALGEQARWGGRVGVTLVKMGFLGEEDLVRALGSHFGIPVVRLAGKRIAPEVVSLLPGEFAEKHGCLPLFMHWENGMEVLYLGMEDPSDLAVLDDVAFRTGLRVRPVLVGPVQIHDAIAEFYGGGDDPSAASTLAAAPAAEAITGSAPVDTVDPVRPDDTPPLPVAPSIPAPGSAPAPLADLDDPDEATQALSPSAAAEDALFETPASDVPYEQTFEPESASGLPEIDLDEIAEPADPADPDALAEAESLAASLDAIDELAGDEPALEVVPPCVDVPPPNEAVTQRRQDPPELAPTPGPAPAAPAPAPAPTPAAAPVAEPAAAPAVEPVVPAELAAPAVPAAPPTAPAAPAAPPAVATAPEPPAPAAALPDPGAGLPPLGAEHLSVPEAPAPADPPPPPAAPETPAADPLAATPLATPAAPLDPPASEAPTPLTPQAPLTPPAPAAEPPLVAVEPAPVAREEPAAPSPDAVVGASDLRNEPAPGDRRESGEDRPQVATRDILRAVTQLLIDNGIFSREELVRQVKAVRTDRRSHD